MAKRNSFYIPNSDKTSRKQLVIQVDGIKKLGSRLVSTGRNGGYQLNEDSKIVEWKEVGEICEGKIYWYSKKEQSRNYMRLEGCEGIHTQWINGFDDAYTEILHQDLMALEQER